jgi:hypothetical protein
LVYLLVFQAYINKMHGSRSKTPVKNIVHIYIYIYIYIHDVKFLALLGAPYIYIYIYMKSVGKGLNGAEQGGWNTGVELDNMNPITAVRYVPPAVTLKMANQSHYRPWQALRFPGLWGSQISIQSTHEGGKVVSPTLRPTILPRKYSWYSFLFEAESTPKVIVRPEGLCRWKFPMTSSEFEPAIFRLLAQCLNHCATGCPIVTVR